MVEGNFQVRRLLKSMLAGLGGEFYECAAGVEALAAYACHQLVPMDIRMGPVDGITATQIRAADPARVIIVTDYDQSDLQEAAHESGACGYVVKDNWRTSKRCLISLPCLNKRAAGGAGNT